jgi:hypothetical protein
MFLLLETKSKQERPTPTLRVTSVKIASSMDLVRHFLHTCTAMSTLSQVHIHVTLETTI